MSNRESMKHGTLSIWKDQLVGKNLSDLKEMFPNKNEQLLSGLLEKFKEENPEPEAKKAPEKKGKSLPEPEKLEEPKEGN